MTTTRQRILLSATLSLCLAHAACDSSSSPGLDGDALAGPDAASAKGTAAAAPDVTKAMDAPADVPACTASGGSCNDDPMVSAIWGTCQSDGTCLCKPGFEINPSTGRCRVPLADAAAATLTCSGEFEDCGCGCCGGVPRNVACYYPTLGESTATLEAKSDASKSPGACTGAGCSAGVRYVCCMPVGPSPSAATYSTSSYMGDMDHVTISKSGSDCATVLMSLPSTTRSELRIDGPPRWGISGYLGACEAGAGTAAEGALGTVAMHPSGESCLVDVHVTLFTFASDGTVIPTSLDADGLLVKDFPASACK